MGTIAKTLMGFVRWILLILDNIVYSLIGIFYNIFEMVANVRLFSGDGENLITTISNRIYALIGVYALFMITFRLINMIINPDDVSSKDKGAGKLATRVIVMLCLTIIVPYIFNLAYDLQSIVLGTKSGNSDDPTGNLIFSLVLGDTNNNKGIGGLTADDMKNTGTNISNQIFASFVTMDDSAISASSCSDSRTYFNSSGSLASDKGPGDLIGKTDETYKKDGKEEWCINYQIVISLLAGGFAAWAFAVYCLDIALRTVKLAFYQLIAPIPIATYIDGKKDGAFNNWVKQSISAYVDVFIRLMVISFLILTITNIPKIMEDLSKVSSTTGGISGAVETGLARAVIILGILMFAMQAPKLIKDLFGIKGDDGSMSMNLGKKLAGAGAVGLAVNRGLSATGAGVLQTGKNTAILGGGALVGGAKGIGGLLKGDKGAALKKNLEQSGKNFAVRQKATGVEALARLQTKNFDKNGAYNKSIVGKDLAAQTLSGNVNAKGGIFAGTLNKMMANAQEGLSFTQTADHKPFGLKMVGKINAQLGNVATTLNTNKLNLEERAKAGDPTAISELSVATSFNAKDEFEKYLKSVQIDPTFNPKDLPKTDAEWTQYTSDFMNFESSPIYSGLNHAEKEAVRAYAEKAAGDLKKAVDTLSKKG